MATSRIAVAGVGALLGVVVAACGGAAPYDPPAKVSVTHLTIPAASPTARADATAPVAMARTDEPTAAAAGSPASPAAPAALTVTSTPAAAGRPAEPGAVSDALAAGRAIRVMPLGDSLTQGSDPDDATRPQTYRGALQRRLQAAGYAVDFVGSDTTPAPGAPDPDNEGHGGFTIGPDESVLCSGCPASNLSAHVDAWIAQAKPDVIVLMAGVNDLFPIDVPTNGAVRPVRPEDAPAKLAALVAQVSAAAPQAEILVASYPPLPMFQAPGASGFSRLRALNDAARAAGERGGRLHYVPLAEELALAWTPADTIADGLHPSPGGADKVAAVIERSLLPVLAPAG